jgi:hypothetical protein
MIPGGNGSPVAQQAAITVIHSRFPSWRAARTSFFSYILRLKTRLERLRTPIMKPFSSILYVLPGCTSCCFILGCSSSNHSSYLCFESAAWRVRSIEVVHLETRLVVFLFKKRLTPRVSHGRCSDLRREISYHIPRWRQRFLCEVVNILYELGFLLWVEFVLSLIFGVRIVLTTAVPSRQRAPRHTILISNCLVSKVFS